MLYLHDDFKKYFSSSLPLFDQLMNLRGECFRQQEGRLTQRIKLGNKYYFIKQHVGIGIKEILKNLLQGRLPVISAKNEWRAIQKLQSLHVNTPIIYGYGERGLNPATKQSFVLMEELAPVICLESFTKTWSKATPSFTSKYFLIKEVARMARILHKSGINHRDFYLCHFLLKKTADQALAVFLIDLHRAQMRRLTPTRWIIKDLAGLYFSSKDIGLSVRDLLRFMSFYSEKELREVLTKDELFWQQVKKRGERLYREHNQ